MSTLDRRIFRITATLCLGLLTVTACGDDNVTGTDGATSGPEVVQSNHSGVRLVVESDDAAPGDTVRVAAMVAGGPEAPAATGFVTELRYRQAALRPLETLDSGNSGLTVMNLLPGEPRLRAAGAAPDGLDDPVLFGVTMEVKSPDYLQGLRLDVEELNVLEGGNLRDAGDALDAVTRPHVQDVPPLRPLSEIVPDVRR